MAKWLPTEWMRQGMFDIIISMQFRWKDSDKKNKPFTCIKTKFIPLQTVSPLKLW